MTIRTLWALAISWLTVAILAVGSVVVLGIAVGAIGASLAWWTARIGW